MSNSAFTPTVLTVPSTGGGGTGQGELSTISNSSAVTDITGWTNVSRVTSNSPLNPLTPTAFSISNAAGAEGATSGGYASFTLPSGLQNRKLKVEFYYTTPATDVYRVSVYKGSTRVPLSTDSSGATNLPKNTTGKFTAYFDTDNSASWTLNVTRTSGTTGPCYITNVVCGPGIQPQGAVVGEWTSYTPTFTGLGTVTSIEAYYRRVGNGLELKVTAVSGTTTATEARMSLPSLTIASAGQTIPALLGKFIRVNATANTYKQGTILGLNGNSYVTFGIDDRTAAESPVTSQQGSALFVAGERFSFFASTAVAEWAGSGTVQLAQNDVEFASNSSTSAADELTQFAYGPSGSLVPTITAATGTPFNYAKRVSFSTPIQSGDRVSLEIQLNGTGPWIPLENLPDQYQSMRVESGSGNRWGMGLIQFAGNNTVDVIFGRAGRLNNGWAGAAGPNYPANVGDRWRVRKSSAGAAVGFGLYQPGVSAGLVSSSGLAGRADGNPIASGYVGESRTGAASTAAIGDGTLLVQTVITSVTAGRYLVIGRASHIISAGGTFSALNHSAGIYYGASNTALTTKTSGYAASSTTASLEVQYGEIFGVLDLSSTQDVKIGVTPRYTGTAPTISVSAVIIRIA